MSVIEGIPSFWKIGRVIPQIKPNKAAEISKSNRSILLLLSYLSHYCYLTSLVNFLRSSSTVICPPYWFPHHQDRDLRRWHPTHSIIWAGVVRQFKRIPHQRSGLNGQETDPVIQKVYSNVFHNMESWDEHYAEPSGGETDDYHSTYIKSYRPLSNKLWHSDLVNHSIFFLMHLIIVSVWRKWYFMP